MYLGVVVWSFGGLVTRLVEEPALKYSNFWIVRQLDFRKGKHKWNILIWCNFYGIEKYRQ